VSIHQALTSEYNILSTFCYAHDSFLPQKIIKQRGLSHSQWQFRQMAHQ